MIGIRDFFKCTWFVSAFTSIIDLWGPIESRVYSQMINLSAFFGFLFGPIVIRAYLPETDEVEVCGDDHNIKNTTAEKVFDIVATPYKVFAAGNFFMALVFFVMMFLPTQFPKHETDEEKGMRVLHNGYVFFHKFSQL